jgi:hypothetical protein
VVLVDDQIREALEPLTAATAGTEEWSLRLAMRDELLVTGIIYADC